MTTLFLKSIIWTLLLLVGVSFVAPEAVRASQAPVKVPQDIIEEASQATTAPAKKPSPEESIHDHHDHEHGHQHEMPTVSDAAPKKPLHPSTKTFKAINHRMHKGMDIQFTGKSDVDFVRGMIPHHEAALEMADVVLQYGKDDEVVDLAENIIYAQKQEIHWMKQWLTRNGTKGKTTPGTTSAYKAVNQKMHKDMAITFSGDADRDFIYGMIPHHQGAIDMSIIQVENGKDREIIGLAKRIIESQQSEILLMRNWLKDQGLPVPDYAYVRCNRENACEKLGDS